MVRRGSVGCIGSHHPLMSTGHCGVSSVEESWRGVIDISLYVIDPKSVYVAVDYIQPKQDFMRRKDDMIPLIAMTSPIPDPGLPACSR